ncbi:flagellar hook-associated protein 2 [Salinibacter ruber]|uniref:flagellar filament capping protein FliD n=1 Tax=Salinibacter ruber TaxID=146919 RepID=UPI00216828C6|nr:flagellar filament capping protein FliD [Salinibacter ruber]MCS3751789.1 flagellar hook-associated protein 2 [Salinibacter ruber]
MGTSIGPSAGLSPQYQRLIQRTLRIERQPKLELQNERQQKKNTKSVVSDLDSKLSSLQSQLSTLADSSSSPFDDRNVDAGTEAFSVSADETASTGSHSLTVDRLASEDGRVSKTYNSGGGSLRTFFDSNGQQTFSVGVSSPTDGNPDAREQISVTVDPSGTTNEEILGNIQTAVDDALQTAVDNGTISSDERPNVSVVNPTSDTARLSLRSSQKGYRGRLGFSDSGSGLLSELQVNAGQEANDSQGGYLTKVGTDEGSSKLTSEFTLDGLTLNRNTNEVKDALDGVTINLDEATGTESSFEVTADEEGAQSIVENFVDRVNEVISFLREKTKINPGSGEGGELSDDTTFRRLSRQLRTDATRPVDGQPEGLNTLADIGIEANRDGTLKLTDEDALRTAVRENQGALKDLFAGPDGVATRMKERVDQYADTGGLLDDRQDSIDSSIDRIDDRIDGLDKRLQRREQQLREQYAEVESTIRSIASQQQSISQRLF